MFVCFISISRAVAHWQFPVDRQLRPSLSSQVNFLIFFQSEHSLFQSLYLSKTISLMRWDVFTSVQVIRRYIVRDWFNQMIRRHFEQLEKAMYLQNMERVRVMWSRAIIWAIKSRASIRSVYQRWQVRQDLEFKRSDWQSLSGSNLKQFQKVRVRNIWAIGEKRRVQLWLKYHLHYFVNFERKHVTWYKSMSGTAFIGCILF